MQNCTRHNRQDVQAHALELDALGCLVVLVCRLCMANEGLVFRVEEAKHGNYTNVALAEADFEAWRTATIQALRSKEGDVLFDECQRKRQSAPLIMGTPTTRYLREANAFARGKKNKTKQKTGASRGRQMQMRKRQMHLGVAKRNRALPKRLCVSCTVVYSTEQKSKTATCARGNCICAWQKQTTLRIAFRNVDNAKVRICDRRCR